jgi:uridylate kinase
MNRLADEVVELKKLGASVGLVIGGGNIVRGTQLAKMGMERVGADYMGMLGTVINALAVQDILERKGVDTRVMTAIRMEESPSRTSGVAPSVTSRWAARSSLPPVRGIHTFRPTRPRCFARSR